MTFHWLKASSFIWISAAARLVLTAQTASQPVRRVETPGVVTTRQTITPAGVPAVFDGRVYGVAFAPAGDVFVLAKKGFYRLDWSTNQVKGRWDAGNQQGLQGVRIDPVRGVPQFTSIERGGKAVLSFLEGGAPELFDRLPGSHQVGGPAFGRRPNSRGVRVIAVPMTYDNKVAILDAEKKAAVQTVGAGVAPFGAVVSADSSVAWVSNWGGRTAVAGDKTAPTGLSPIADRVVVDARGIAATGTLSRVDLVALQVTHTIPVGLHPTALAWNEAAHRLYVANSNSDSISVIDTKTNQAAATFDLRPFAEAALGLAPTALALTGDGHTLYVAMGGVNAVAVMDASSGKIRGMIPTAWYPSDLALSSSGKHLAVAALLGAGSGWQDEPKRKFVHAYRGSVQVIDIPSPSQLASYTSAVAENNHLTLAGNPLPKLQPSSMPTAIPARAGDPSLIEHVVFIVKENRTYDQVLGGLGKGNGDPSLVMFGEDVTPNQHKLAREFVVLDNFYATGGNSADGHQWLTQANETAYCLWPGYEGRSYPFDGTDPIAISKGGFIWETALARKKSVKVYGEYAPRLSEVRFQQRAEYLARWRKGDSFRSDFHSKAAIEPLNSILVSHFPTYTIAIPDVVRARIFLDDLKQWESEGAMPNLVIMQLPSNHTYGTRGGASTPKAMVADNDLALGQVVEKLSHSRFWNKMAIFVVEDDAQNGVDHVDGHRTVALVASPYARRGIVDSTFYSHQSMLKSIELILGLPTLSLFDLIANDMRASFQNAADATPYTAVVPKQSLDETNPLPQALNGAPRQAALDSGRMRWDVPDAVPTERLNRILWGAIRGWNVPYPGTKRSVFSPLSLDIDDDDR